MVVIATTRGEKKKKFLLDTGADHVIQTDSEALVERVMAITGNQGANLIFDPIGGPIVEQLADSAGPGAIIFEYGALDTAATPFPLFAALKKGLTIRGYTLFEITQDTERLARAKSFLYSGLKTGALKPIIDRTFTLEEIVKAHQYMESNQQTGKIVVTVG